MPLATGGEVSDAYSDLMMAMPVERLVQGEPVGIDQLAQTMLRWSDLLADAAQALRRVDVVWTGQAADAFQTEFQLQPAAFSDAATAMDDAGYALGSYGIAFHSAREAASIALETFQRGVRAGLAARAVVAAASAAVGGVGGFMPTSGPVDLRDEPVGLQDRLTGVEKLTAAREALRGAGDRAATSVHDAMTHAPQQVSALDHGANFMSGGWSEERADFTVGAARGVLDLGTQAAFPIVAPLVMSPVNQALDDLEWRWNIGSGSGFHQAGSFIIPTIATGAAGGLGAGVEARAPRVIAAIIPPKGVNPEPVILFRGMVSAEDGFPLLGATAKTLGARPKVVLPRVQGDIPIDPQGEVWPNTGGMSANLDAASIPSYRLPEAWGGEGKDLDLYAILHDDLPDDLIFSLKDKGHGFIEPIRPMSYDEMQQLIHMTRFAWRKVLPAE